MTADRTCVVCGDPLDEAKGWTHHQRLNVDVCLTCPRTNVMGEDTTSHCVFWVAPRPAREDQP